MIRVIKLMKQNFQQALKGSELFMSLSTKVQATIIEHGSKLCK